MISEIIILTFGIFVTSAVCVNRYCEMKEWIHTHSDKYRP